MNRLIKLFSFNDSRKVGFGLWLNLASTILLIYDKITSADWLATVFLSSALIGGGTLIDTYLKRPNAPTGTSHNKQDQLVSHF